MTIEQLRAVVGESVEEKLLEMFGDPDAGLELRPEFIAELGEQEKRIAAGERGIPLEQVMRKYGIA